MAGGETHIVNDIHNNSSHWFGNDMCVAGTVVCVGRPDPCFEMLWFLVCVLQGPLMVS